MDLSRYASGRYGRLQQMDGRIKTGVLLPAVVIASTLNHWWLALGLWLAASGLFFLVCQDRKALFRRLLMPLGIAWLVLLSQMLTQGHHSIGQLTIAHLQLQVYQEGLHSGILLFLRIMAAVTLAALLSFTTPMIDILATLRLCRLPETMVDLAEMMLRYIFLLNDTAQTMHRAQLSRLGAEASWLRRVRDTAGVAGSILIRSLERSTRIYKSMLSRGYHENSRPAEHFRHAITRRDRHAGLLGGLLLLLVLLINLRTA